jgi:hypothetical protein
MNANTRNNSKHKQSGQTLVEFVLLLASITIISFTFLKVVNSNIGDRWKVIYELILDDPNQKVELR